MKNNNPKGIILILLGMLVFSVQDSIMKYIFSFVSLYEVYLIRTLVSLIVILLFLKTIKQLLNLPKFLPNKPRINLQNYKCIS